MRAVEYRRTSSIPGFSRRCSRPKASNSALTGRWTWNGTLGNQSDRANANNGSHDRGKTERLFSEKATEQERDEGIHVGIRRREGRARIAEKPRVRAERDDRS